MPKPFPGIGCTLYGGLQTVLWTFSEETMSLLIKELNKKVWEKFKKPSNPSSGKRGHSRMWSRNLWNNFQQIIGKSFKEWNAELNTNTKHQTQTQTNIENKSLD